MRSMCKIISAFLAAALLMSGLPLQEVVYALPAAEQKGTVRISTAEEFREFAENCVLDSYSVGKVFVLENDISLAGTDIKPVPSFGGIFDGKGHTVSGLNITDSASVTGLFRCIEKNGTVKNLNVSGSASPAGTAEKCGGIAGVNRGRIVSCSFSGTVSGRDRCGGIAGVNEDGAVISSCRVSGRIQADHFTGGIVGENFGYIVSCTNESSVNTNVTDESPELEDISVEELYTTEGISDVTDIGGITGFSSGSVQGCRNSGAVGYPHIGYNIGGIAGRQDGYISGCQNYGAVSGRKDVGGIVGQAEPHFMISYSQSRADRLKESLEQLGVLIGNAVDDAESGTAAVSGSFGSVNASLESIRNRSDSMMSEAERIVNADISSVNELSSRVSDFIDMLPPVVDSVTASADSVSEGFDKLTEAGGLLGDSLNGLDEGTEIIFGSLDELDGAVTELQNASSSVSSALMNLREGLGDPQKMADALDALENDIYAVKFAVSSVSGSAAALLKAMDEFGGAQELEDSRERIRAALTAVSEDAAELSDALDRLSRAIDTLSEKLSAENHVYIGGTDDLIYDEYGEYLDILKDIIDDGSLRELAEAAADVIGSMSELIWDISELSSALSEIIDSSALDNFNDDIAAVFDEMKKDAEYLSGLTDENVSSPELDAEKLYLVLDCLKNASDSAAASGEHAKSALELVQDSWDFLSGASANAVAASYCASEASSDISEAADSLGRAAEGIGGITDFFAEKSDIVFVGADDGLIEARGELSSELEALTAELDRLNGSASDMSNILAEDIRAINDQCAVIADIIFEMIGEIRDAALEEREYTEDVSAEDSRGYAEGKIASCTNYGEVSGDLNTGGIAGTMGTDNSFDPESDTAEAIGERSLSFMYMLRTVVRDCNSYGKITSKKNAAGGIVGEMSTGCVIGCGGFGDVSSSSGGFVGGVAGDSAARIIGSSAMCSLEGGDYVGGIAGRGADISGCRSFCEIKNSDEFSGAVVGQCTGELSDNAFVENGSGAADGISYAEKAYPVSYKEMLSLSGVPDEFKTIKLIFTADGEIVDTLEYSYGDSVNEEDIPAIPEKRGCFAEWEEFDGSDLKFGKTVNAEYRNLITALASDACRDDGLPLFVVEGSFGSEELSVYESKGNGVCWLLTVPDDGAETHTVRYYADENETELFVNNEPVEYERDGRYLVFTSKLNQFELSARKQTVDETLIIYAAIGAAAVVIIIVVFSALSRKRKKGAKDVRNNDPK
ncbi:MAG: hypothetical protein NC394_09540 [Bacteroides sp.]|nr:hypothetical protein [Bacteroides sp.]